MQHDLSMWCRYVVPAESAARFEAALQQQQQGPDSVAQLTAKHLYCSLPVQLLKQLGVKRFLQMPGYAVLTYPVRPPAPPLPLPTPVILLHVYGPPIPSCTPCRCCHPTAFIFLHPFLHPSLLPYLYYNSLLLPHG